ncbi:MAG: hypothetical protein CVV42_08820 [Candidatus Riflebacteria bacterium HGW-Riflebacteria-2]|jgi:uncharacterized protein YecT (DUF1311 family)|nr:MAG: hypothetical protein CVV42_08820 [Candidatus Riflebacteria bacterium HGW-Riflebacteria-2]
MKFPGVLLACVLLSVTASAQTEVFTTSDKLTERTDQNSAQNFDENFAEELHPIDREVNRLMEADESTNGQIQALAKGYELWDAELNSAYKELMQAYSNNEKLKATLKEAQLAWIKYRDASFKHFEEVCTSKDGSMYRVFLAHDRMDFVKSRALELRAMYGSFTETN